jgi:glutamine---fructose-6-phosphate transaminase (isomerizing)
LSHTYEEIKNQPTAWRLTVPAVTEQWKRISASLDLGERTHFLFVGSGSSLYISQVAAQVMQEATGHVSSAVPSSDVFLSTGSTVPQGVPVIAFVISRSGRTSEALIATDHLRSHCRSVTVVGVTCNADTELERRADYTLALPHASERAVVMTQSFTSMLLALQVVAAIVADDDALLEELSHASSELETRFPQYEEFARSIGEDTDRRQYIFLGLGPNFGAAQEGTLKLKEMTQTICEAYGPLEFRHGPISIVGTDTVVVLLEGERERAYVGDLESQLRQYGARVATIAPFASTGGGSCLELPKSLRDIARSVMAVPALQLIAYRRALALGFNPDQPRNLTQVVELSA